MGEGELELLVAGDSDTVAMFSLLGARGFLVDTVEQLKDLVGYVEQHGKKLGGILMAGHLYDEQSKDLRKIRASGIPMLFLPTLEGEAGAKVLEELTERALGMKLKLE